MKRLTASNTTNPITGKIGKVDKDVFYLTGRAKQVYQVPLTPQLLADMFTLAGSPAFAALQGLDVVVYSDGGALRAKAAELQED